MGQQAWKPAVNVTSAGAMPRTPRLGQTAVRFRTVAAFPQMGGSNGIALSLFCT